MVIRIFCILSLLLLVLPGCAPKVKLFASKSTEPLQEFVLQGSGEGKVALIHLTGILRSQPEQGMLRAQPSPVQETVAALNLAAKDPSVKAVVLGIDSPGGTVTASDILYHELLGFKRTTGKKVVVVMFDVAASGGYYAALPADWIMAHPTTVTGSVGVIFMRPKLTGLMGKVGVDVEVTKSGTDKDMGSPFRPTSKDEVALFDSIVSEYAERFYSLVAKHRQLSDEQMNLVKTARVFTAVQAEAVGLVDQIGYIQDGFAKARSLAGLSDDARVVTYRRDLYPNDNPYNTMTEAGGGNPSLLGVDAGFLLPPKAGFYYLWFQGTGQ